MGANLKRLGQGSPLRFRGRNHARGLGNDSFTAKTHELGCDPCVAPALTTIAQTSECTDHGKSDETGFPEDPGTFDAQGSSAWNVLTEAYDYAIERDTDLGHGSGKSIGALLLAHLLMDAWKYHGKYTLARIAYATLLRKIFSCNDVSREGIDVGTGNERDAICEKVCSLGVAFRDALLSAFGCENSPRHDYINDYRWDDTGPMSGRRLNLLFFHGAGRPTSDRLQLTIQALVRDGFKCPITGFYDYYAIETLVRRPVITEEMKNGTLRPWHIIPLPSEDSDSEDYDPEAVNQGPVPLLEMLGLWETVRNMPALHTVANVISLHATVWGELEGYIMWLEEVDEEPNVYRVVEGAMPFWERYPHFKPPPGGIRLCVDESVISNGAELGMDISNFPVAPDRELIAFRAMSFAVTSKSSADSDSRSLLEVGAVRKLAGVP
ncbi:hypothetical protein NMY22_g2457 [Coprinellus aureogranulatus]|nr:hypothetical protein NMY22_g2457 [Coprinellus aureogranulatus]